MGSSRGTQEAYGWRKDLYSQRKYEYEIINEMHSISSVLG
jgi:hypothetical protein